LNYFLFKLKQRILSIKLIRFLADILLLINTFINNIMSSPHVKAILTCNLTTIIILSIAYIANFFTAEYSFHKGLQQNQVVVYNFLTSQIYEGELYNKEKEKEKTPASQPEAVAPGGKSPANEKDVNKPPAPVATTAPANNQANSPATLPHVASVVATTPPKAQTAASQPSAPADKLEESGAKHKHPQPQDSTATQVVANQTPAPSVDNQAPAGILDVVTAAIPPRIMDAVTAAIPAGIIDTVTAAIPARIRDAVTAAIPAAILNAVKPAAPAGITDDVTAAAPAIPADPNPTTPIDDLETKTPEELIIENKLATNPKLINVKNLEFRAPDLTPEYKDKYKIVIVIGGLGLSSQTTEYALRLINKITLGFSPYANNLSGWIDKAKYNGYETIINLPMEPYDYKTNDPGPYALLQNSSNTNNIANLDKVILDSYKCVGVYTTSDEVFSQSRELIAPIFDRLSQNNYIYLNGNKPADATLSKIAADYELEFRTVDIFINFEVNNQVILDNLNKLQDIAKDKGYAIGFINPYPTNIDVLEKWIKSLDPASYAIVPLSTILPKRLPISTDSFKPTDASQNRMLEEDFKKRDPYDKTHK
jgi:polysaccharide deacetylase 2 family uncharacterized protein YibQ